jgi:hypothetical protein
VERDRFDEYERCVDILHGFLEPPTAHSDPKDDHLWGKRLTEKGGTVRLPGVRTTRVWEDSTQNMVQTQANAHMSGLF